MPNHPRPWDDWHLEHIVNDELPKSSREYGPTVFWRGLAITRHEDTYWVTVNGHVNDIDTFDVGEYDDKADLMERLFDHVQKHTELWHRYRHEDDTELIEWAGKQLTTDEHLADEDPDRYMFIPA